MSWRSRWAAGVRGTCGDVVMNCLPDIQLPLRVVPRSVRWRQIGKQRAVKRRYFLGRNDAVTIKTKTWRLALRFDSSRGEKFSPSNLSVLATRMMTPSELELTRRVAESADSDGGDCVHHQSSSMLTVWDQLIVSRVNDDFPRIELVIWLVVFQIRKQEPKYINREAASCDDQQIIKIKSLFYDCWFQWCSERCNQSFISWFLVFSLIRCTFMLSAGKDIINFYCSEKLSLI